MDRRILGSGADFGRAVVIRVYIRPLFEVRLYRRYLRARSDRCGVRDGEDRLTNVSNQGPYEENSPHCASIPCEQRICKVRSKLLKSPHLSKLRRQCEVARQN